MCLLKSAMGDSTSCSKILVSLNRQNVSIESSPHSGEHHSAIALHRLLLLYLVLTYVLFRSLVRNLAGLLRWRHYRTVPDSHDCSMVVCRDLTVDITYCNSVCKHAVHSRRPCSNGHTQSRTPRSNQTAALSRPLNSQRSPASPPGRPPQPCRPPLQAQTPLPNTRTHT